MDPDGPPPTFTVRTNRALCDVEIASDPLLLGGGLANRRTAANYASSREGAPLVVTDGSAQWSVEPGAWTQLARQGRYLAYRAVAYNGTRSAPVRAERTVPDDDLSSAPALLVSEPGIRITPATPPSRLSALTWLRVEDNRVVDANGDAVVLRGVNLPGLESSAPGDPDPTGATSTTSAGAAGITEQQIAEIISDWLANVLRVPINQERVLSSPDYLLDLDRIVEAASVHGAYTILALRWFDRARTFGLGPDGHPSHQPPLPEENSLRCWRSLAARYRRQPGVLYDLLSDPHTPTASDHGYPFERLATDADWTARWHAWIRRLESAIHRMNPRALILVSGWRYGLDLSDFPVKRPHGRSVANTVYAAHVDPTAVVQADFGTTFAIPQLLDKHPVFVTEWRADASQLAFAIDLERYLRERHRYREGRWRGLTGWAAWSWGVDPLLVERRDESRGANGRTTRWRSFVMDGRHYRPTETGEFVRAALRVHPFAASADFDPGRPRGQRARYLISLPSGGDLLHGRLFTVAGHDFTPGTTVNVSVGGATISIQPRAVLPHLLVFSALPPAVPAGAGTLDVARPDGLHSESLAVTVRAAALPAATTLVTGAAKPHPYTLVFLANPAVELQGGGLAADPIISNRAAFHDCVADAIASLFGRRETLIVPYAAEIAVVAYFSAAAVQDSNALCRELPIGAMMEPRRDHIKAFLTAAGLSGDVCFTVFSSATHPRSTSWFTSDDESSPGRTFAHDLAQRAHRRSNTTPGTVALAAPTDQMTALHEFGHAASDFINGRVVDLYVDNPVAAFEVQHKRLSAAGSIPPRFARYHDRSWDSDPSSLTRLHRPAAWLSYGPDLVDPGEPNVMDNYYQAADPTRCGFDRLARAFLRERIEWKLGR